MSIDGRNWQVHGQVRIEAAGGELHDGLDLFARDVGLLDDLVDAAPASRFSNTAETGMRVSLKTHAPLSLPGTLSTAGH